MVSHRVKEFCPTLWRQNPIDPVEWFVSLVIGQHQEFYQYLSNLKRGRTASPKWAHMIYDIACSKHIAPSLNHLKIIARRAQQCLINICRCSSSKEVLQKHFKMKLAGPSDMILDLSTPPLYRVWTNIFFVSHRNQLSDRSENLSKHFQISRKF